MARLITILMAATVAILSTGCSMMAPQYTASLDNVQRWRIHGKGRQFRVDAGQGERQSNFDPWIVAGIALPGLLRHVCCRGH